MISASVTLLGVEAVSKNLEKTRQGALRDLTRTRQRAGEFAAERARRLYRTVRHVRSGTLWRSVNRRTVPDRGAPDGRAEEAGTPTHYALKLEHGGEVKPKGRTRMFVSGRRADGSLRFKRSQGRHLTIPIGEAKTKAGVAKDRSISRIAFALARGGPFSTFVRDSILYLAQGGELTPLAVLKESVYIKGKPVWTRVAKDVNRTFPRELYQAIERTIRRHGGA